MSLDQLVQKTKRTHYVENNVPLFLPPEYNLSEDEWRLLIQEYNASGRRTKLATVIGQYIQSQNPSKKIPEQVINVGNISEKNGMFFTDLSFENDKIGMTAWVIFKQQDLQLVPVVGQGPTASIRHVVLTYVPD